MKGSFEHNLWAAVLMQRVNDAMGPFFVGEPIELQYDQLRQKLARDPRRRPMKRMQLQRISGTSDPFICSKARKFLESSEFDTIAQLIGYDTEFVRRTFDMVQEAVSYEKKLWDEFGGREWM